MPALAEPRQILVVSRSQPLSRAAADVLRERHTVEEVHTPEEARAWLARNRADLAVVEVDLRELARTDSYELLAAVDGVRGGGVPLLGLIRTHEDVPLKVLFERSCIPNFLAAAEEGRLDAFDLDVTVSKLIDQDIFGTERYLAPGTRWREFKVNRSDQREPLILAAQEFALDAGCHPRVAERVALAADEMLSNALYNAPVDANGLPRFASLPRTVPVMLAPTEEVVFRLATDGRRLAVAAADPFGTLDPTTVLHYLAKCFAQGDDQIDNKPGGAGLGLYCLFNLLHHFVINIAPGRRTETIGLLDITRSYREFAARAKSLNIFVSGSR